MADWKKIREDVKQTANKALKKTGEMADMASLRIKAATIKRKLEKAYEGLGRLTYKQLKTEESRAEEIAAQIEEIDSLRDELAGVAQEIRDFTRNHEEQKTEDNPSEEENNETV